MTLRDKGEEGPKKGEVLFDVFYEWPLASFNNKLYKKVKTILILGTDSENLTIFSSRDNLSKRAKIVQKGK